MGCMELSSKSSAEIGSPRDETGVSVNLWNCPKEVKPLVLYGGVRWIALKPMQGNRSSFRFDLGYTKLFHTPSVTSMFF